MKKLLIILMLGALMSLKSFATGYYVDTTGNDNNTGLSEAQAWKTLSRVQTALNVGTIQALDRIYLKRGQIFYGQLVLNKRSLSFDAYGSGAWPVISGFKSITALQADTGGLYKVVIPESYWKLNLVTLNDSLLDIAVTDSSANGGYFKFKCGLDSNLVMTPDSTTLVGVSNAIVGRKMFARRELHRLEKLIINTIMHDSVTYRRGWGLTSGGQNTLEQRQFGGNGYVWYGHQRDCSTRGEWAMDSATKTLYIFLPGGLGSNVLKAAIFDYGIDCRGMSDINISHIAFEGQNLIGVGVDNGNRLKVDSCSFRNIGAIGVSAVASQNAKVTNSIFKFNTSEAIHIRNSSKDSVTITGNDVRSTGLWKQGAVFQDDFTSVSVVARNYVNITSNYIDSSGKHGINWNGNFVDISYNIVKKCCQVVSDAGEIYGYNPDTAISLMPLVLINYEGRVIHDNQVGGGYGNPFGTRNINRLASGIYMDGKTKKVKVIHNYIHDVIRWGVESNYSNDIVIDGNIFYNNTTADIISSKKGVNASSIFIKNNIFYRFDNNTYPDSRRFNLIFQDELIGSKTKLQSATAYVMMDSNWFNKTSLNNFRIDALSSSVNLNLSAWSAGTGNDKNSIVLTDLEKDQAFVITNETGQTKYVYLGAVYVDVKGNRYSQTITLNPFETHFLMYLEPLIPVPTYKINGIRWQQQN